MTIAIRTQEEAQQVLHSIRYIEDYRFPQKELEALLAHPEQSVPIMLDKLKNVYQNPRKYATKDNFDMGIVYSYYLLSQLRETRAFPIMLDLLTLKYAVLDDIFGYDLTEACGRILASTYDGDWEKLKALMENEKAYPFARGCATQAMEILVLEGKLDRLEVLLYFEKLANRLAKTSLPDSAQEVVITELVLHAENLYPAEISETIYQLMDAGKVDERMIVKENIEDTIARPMEKVLRDSHKNFTGQPLDDAVGALKNWVCYVKPVAPLKVLSESAYADENEENELLEWVPGVVKEQAVSQKVGRNEPCPCGSGKKYKKCCGA